MTDITYITNSERGTAACPQRWFLQYGCGLRPEKTNKTLSAGSLFHAALDAYFQQAELTAPDDVSALEAGRSVLATWKDAADARLEASRQRSATTFSPDEDAAPEQIGEDLETWALVRDVYEEYVDHYAVKLKGWRFVLNESTLKSLAVTPNGNTSTRTGIAGKVDRVVVSPSGDYWLMEHKLTSMGLQQYINSYCRSPQPYTYGWLLRRANIHVRGVIYDLSLRVQRDAPESLDVLKSGDRLAKVKGLPKMSAEAFRRRVEQVHDMPLEEAAAIDFQKPAKDGTLGEPKLDCAWYLDTYHALIDAEAGGRWFKWNVRNFAPGDMKRIERELYHDATRIRQMDDRLAISRTKVSEGAMTVQDMVTTHAPEFSRSPGMCHSFGRLCPYYDTCQTGEISPNLVHVAVRHVELEETSDMEIEG